MKVEYIEHLGSDLLVVNAARVSMDKESDWASISVSVDGEGDSVLGLGEGDKRLISYLAKHNHWTPFSHPQICMRETVPIFVARQRFKHMVGFTYNEVSRRYVDSEPEFYTPDVWRSRPEGSIKQGSGGSVIESITNPLSPSETLPMDGYYNYHMTGMRNYYNRLLEAGVAPEQARMVLPQSMYTSYYVTGSLSAWARAYKLRSDSHSQVEIQDLAKQWDEVIAPLFPESWEVLTR